MIITFTDVIRFAGGAGLSVPKHSLESETQYNFLLQPLHPILVLLLPEISSIMGRLIFPKEPFGIINSYPCTQGYYCIQVSPHYYRSVLWHRWPAPAHRPLHPGLLLPRGSGHPDPWQLHLPRGSLLPAGGGRPSAMPLWDVPGEVYHLKLDRLCGCL